MAKCVECGREYSGEDTLATRIVVVIVVVLLLSLILQGVDEGFSEFIDLWWGV